MMTMSLMSHRCLSLGALVVCDHLDQVVDHVGVCNRLWVVASGLIQGLLE